jgi:indole-3-glycerol phosphate synthase
VSEPGGASGGVLGAILAAKRGEIERLGQAPGAPAVRDGAPAVRDGAVRDGAKRARDVVAALRRSPGQPLRLIAENKRKSPSAGALSTVLTTAERVVRYASAGATMISVLCDETFFGGSWADLAGARRALDAAGHGTPLLAKEFILDARQLREAQVCGADAVLLIARILDEASLRALFTQARDLGLEPLVEVATEDELAWAVGAGARLIGVNARDLDTLVMDAARAARVLDAIPAGAVPLYLSGLKGPDDVRRVARTRAHAALLGETLMRQDDPHAQLTALVAAAAEPPAEE